MNVARTLLGLVLGTLLIAPVCAGDKGKPSPKKGRKAKVIFTSTKFEDEVEADFSASNLIKGFPTFTVMQEGRTVPEALMNLREALKDRLQPLGLEPIPLEIEPEVRAIRVYGASIFMGIRGQFFTCWATSGRTQSMVDQITFLGSRTKGSFSGEVDLFFIALEVKSAEFIGGKCRLVIKPEPIIYGRYKHEYEAKGFAGIVHVAQMNSMELRTKICELAAPIRTSAPPRAPATGERIQLQELPPAIKVTAD